MTGATDVRVVSPLLSVRSPKVAGAAASDSVRLLPPTTTSDVVVGRLTPRTLTSLLPVTWMEGVLVVAAQTTSEGRGASAAPPPSGVDDQLPAALHNPPAAPVHQIVQPDGSTASSSRICTAWSFVSSAMIPLTGVERWTLKATSGLTALSSRIGTVNVLEFSPGANVKVPDLDV